MDKASELKAAKKTALLLLLGAACIFVAMAVLPRSPWVDGMKAVSEAAMVGAMADWFAVVALFQKVPIPFVSVHTNIIPKNKDKIAENLATFVKEKFLDAASLVELIKKHDPAQRISDWLTEPVNNQIVGEYVVKLVSGILDVMDDTRIQAFMKEALHAVLAKIDLSKSMGTILDTLTKDGRHQELLDDCILHLVALLREPDSRNFIAARIVDWLKTEHPLKEKLLPTTWLGENGAEMIANALDRVLRQINEDPSHELRNKFDAAVQRLIVRLKSDPSFLEKGEEIKRYLRDGEIFTDYIKNIWGQFRSWLKRDIASRDSRLHERVVATGKWIGRELANNPELRKSLNEHMEDLARTMAPDFSDFLTRHISDTVKKWDPADMSRQIELNIGKDLQYIRINGTIVGGVIGLVLYLTSLLIAYVRVSVA